MADKALTIEKLQAAMKDLEDTMLLAAPELVGKLGRDLALKLLTARPAGEINGMKIFESSRCGTNEFIMVGGGKVQVADMGTDQRREIELPTFSFQQKQREG